MEIETALAKNGYSLSLLWLCISFVYLWRAGQPARLPDATHAVEPPSQACPSAEPFPGI